MNVASYHRRIISGRLGLLGSAARLALGTLEPIYASMVRLRNRKYDAGIAVTALPIPVISIGNITVGGTGKTPLVIDLAQRLDALNKSPAVVARGYGAEPGQPNDEQRMIQRHCPSVLYEANPDRIKAARTAHNRYGADVIVIDDGFQHRRLARDLDIVLIDATCPFGYDRLLPRGLLREPVDSLQRADLVLITRCKLVATADVDRIQERISSIAPKLPILQADYRFAGIKLLDGSNLTEIEGLHVVLFAGIGNPDAFRTSVKKLGARVVGQRWFPDHYRYSPEDMDSLLRTGAFPPHDLLLTTEKDAVKLEGLPSLSHARIGVVRIEMEYLDDDSALINEAIHQVLR